MNVQWQDTTHASAPILLHIYSYFSLLIQRIYQFLPPSHQNNLSFYPPPHSLAFTGPILTIYTAPKVTRNQDQTLSKLNSHLMNHFSLSCPSISELQVWEAPPSQILQQTRHLSSHWWSPHNNLWDYCLCFHQWNQHQPQLTN